MNLSRILLLSLLIAFNNLHMSMSNVVPNRDRKIVATPLQLQFELGASNERSETFGRPVNHIAVPETDHRTPQHSVDTNASALDSQQYISEPILHSNANSGKFPEARNIPYSTGDLPPPQDSIHEGHQRQTNNDANNKANCSILITQIEEISRDQIHSDKNAMTKARKGFDALITIESRETESSASPSTSAKPPCLPRAMSSTRILSKLGGANEKSSISRSPSQTSEMPRVAPASTQGGQHRTSTEKHTLQKLWNGIYKSFYPPSMWKKPNESENEPDDNYYDSDSDSDSDSEKEENVLQPGGKLAIDGDESEESTKLAIDGDESEESTIENTTRKPHTSVEELLLQQRYSIDNDCKWKCNFPIIIDRSSKNDLTDQNSDLLNDWVSPEKTLLREVVDTNCPHTRCKLWKEASPHDNTQHRTWNCTISNTSEFVPALCAILKEGEDHDERYVLSVSSLKSPELEHIQDQVARLTMLYSEHTLHRLIGFTMQIDSPNHPVFNISEFGHLFKTSTFLNLGGSFTQLVLKKIDNLEILDISRSEITNFSSATSELGSGETSCTNLRTLILPARPGFQMPNDVSYKFFSKCNKTSIEFR